MSYRDKIVSLDEAVALRRRWGADSLRVIFANGCFDVLHVGHARYLQGARALGDRLIVGVNSDAGAGALKGPGRPVLPEQARAELVAAFGCVDAVVLFGEPTVERLLRQLRPDVHAKGTDYTPDTVPERALAAECGFAIAITGDPKDHSSRDLLRRIRTLESAS